MTVGVNDISFILSGGPSNINPNASLGGEPSSQPILSNLLFDDLTDEQTQVGRTDFRCFYLTNDHPSDSLYNTKIFIAEEVPEGASTEFGILNRNDRQQITIGNYSGLTGGSFVLRYENNDITVPFNSTPSSFASTLEAKIQSIGEITEGAFVSARISGASIIFEIEFQNASGMRYHPLIQDVSNNLTPSGSSISTSKLVDGSPINSVAGEIDAATTEPAGVVFSYPTESSPLDFGAIHGLDVVAIWVKREIPPLGLAVENDGFTIRVIGEPIKSV